MSIGKLWRYFGNRRGMIILLGQFVVVLTTLFFYSGYQSSDECVRCHADRDRMTALGHPEFTMTPEQVWKESRHPNVECRDCHLGNGLSADPAQAHKGMLKLLVLDNDLNVVPRKGLVRRLLPSGDDRLRAMLPRDSAGDPVYEVGTLMWHDRDPVTLGYDPAIAQKTCGKAACHPDEVKQFGTSVMGSNFRQRSMGHWKDSHGPNNCGPSFADVPPTGRAEGDRFSFENTAAILSQINTTLTRDQAVAKQKACNLCHTGCLDCHYTPAAGGGAHSMSRVPPSANCTSGGRSTFVCHAGTMERRRGDSYLGAEFSEPAGLPEDVHVKEKIECVDCHQTGPGGMGHIERRATCQDCHIEVEEALAASVHKNLTCEACHVKALGGYELTSWGAGKVLSKPNPFKKYSLYYGPQQPPVLIKNQQGRWMPVKIWPNSVGFIKDEVKPTPGLTWRWPDGATRDAFVQLGTFAVPGGNNNYLAWLQVEQVAHPLGKSRTCESCHAGAAQIAQVTWRFYDSQGAEPFTGSQRVVADKQGLRVVDIRATSNITAMEGGRAQDFAAWLLLGDIWRTAGDFSIPTADREKYRVFEERAQGASKEIARINAELKEREARGEDVKKLRRRWKEDKAARAHEPLQAGR